MTTSRLPRLATLSVAVLLVAACAGTRERPDTSSTPLPATTMPTDAVVVAEAFLTPPLPRHEIDSVAAWLSPGGDTWLIATGKESNQLVVYDGDTGAVREIVGGPGEAPGEFRRPNGIAVYADLLFVVERDNKRVQVLELPSFRPIAIFGAGELKNPYGLWLRETVPGELEMLVTDSFMADYATETVPPLAELSQRVKRYRVVLAGERPSATLLGQFGDTTEAGALRMVESIAGDPANDRVLIAEEDVRVGTTLREYRLDGRWTGQSLPRFQSQAEGVALWACPDGRGYWIAADQSKERTVFHLFDRRDLHFAGSFTGTTLAMTDGIWLQAAGSRRFPYGVLYAAHDDAGAGAFDWRDIATALKLPRTCDGP